MAKQKSTQNVPTCSHRHMPCKFLIFSPHLCRLYSYFVLVLASGHHGTSTAALRFPLRGSAGAQTSIEQTAEHGHGYLAPSGPLSSGAYVVRTRQQRRAKETTARYGASLVSLPPTRRVSAAEAGAARPPAPAALRAFQVKVKRARSTVPMTAATPTATSTREPRCM